MKDKHLKIFEDSSDQQFDLFKSFVSNDASEASNSMEIWESIPKYFFTASQVSKIVPEKGQPDPFEWSYTNRGRGFKVVVQPALIKEKDGSYKAYFPSSKEELIENALIKILSEQDYGGHSSKKNETWVRFSLRMIYKELKKAKKTEDINRIKLGIKILSRCVISVYDDNDNEVWSGQILQDLITQTRSDYLENGNALHVARLPIFISRAITNLEVRQYNYKRSMGLKGQLARWIHKRLVHRYTYASLVKSHNFKFSSLKQSGLLQLKTEADARKKVIKALDELKDNNIINGYEVLPYKQGKKVIDVKYVLQASIDFISEQKASNKRASELKTIKNR